LCGETFAKQQLMLAVCRRPICEHRYRQYHLHQQSITLCRRRPILHLHQRDYVYRAVISLMISGMSAVCVTSITLIATQTCVSDTHEHVCDPQLVPYMT
jgi:hypothetical protein